MVCHGRVTLAENAGAGNGTAKEWKGGRGFYMAEATWSGGSAKLQFQTPNSTWIDVTSVTLSANGGVAFQLPPCQIRVVIATSTAVYAYAAHVPE